MGPICHDPYKTPQQVLDLLLLWTWARHLGDALCHVGQCINGEQNTESGMANTGTETAMCTSGAAGYLLHMDLIHHSLGCRPNHWNKHSKWVDQPGLHLEGHRDDLHSQKCLRPSQLHPSWVQQVFMCFYRGLAHSLCCLPTFYTYFQRAKITTSWNSFQKWMCQFQLGCKLWVWWAVVSCCFTVVTSFSG